MMSFAKHKCCYTQKKGMSTNQASHPLLFLKTNPIVIHFIRLLPDSETLHNFKHLSY